MAHSQMRLDYILEMSHLDVESDGIYFEYVIEFCEIEFDSKVSLNSSCLLFDSWMRLLIY